MSSQHASPGGNASPFDPSAHGGDFDPNAMNFEEPSSAMPSRYDSPGGGYFSTSNMESQQNAQSPRSPQSPQSSHGGDFDPNAVSFDTPDINLTQLQGPPILSSPTGRVHTPPRVHSPQVHRVPVGSRSPQLPTHSESFRAQASPPMSPSQYTGQTSQASLGLDCPLPVPLQQSYTSPPRVQDHYKGSIQHSGDSLPRAPTQSTYAPYSHIQKDHRDSIYHAPDGGRSTQPAGSYGYPKPEDRSNMHIREVYPGSPENEINKAYPVSHSYSAHSSEKKQQEYVVDVEVQNSETKEGLSNRVPRVGMKGYVGHFFFRGTSHQIRRRPHAFQNPNFKAATKETYRHRDALQREYKGAPDDRYLNPIDGRVMELVVQCSDRVYRGPKNSTYKRTFIRNVAPLTLRVASWPMDHVDEHPEAMAGKWEKLRIAIKWPITCYIMYHLIGIPGVASTGKVVNGGNYDPFPYRYWGYCKVSRNSLENTIASSVALDGAAKASTIERNRVLEPRYLMFLGHTKYGTRRLLSEWKNDPTNQHHHGKCPDYLFIAYTAEHFSPDSQTDGLALHEIATKATRKAGLSAYWVGYSCMERDNIEDDVYRISDIVRGAHSMVIAVGPGGRDYDPHISTSAMLQHWGERMWTLPEALLITPRRPITVYRRGEDTPLIVPKNQFASLAWTDSIKTRQLIDHYEGNLTLSRLELVIIAMQTLFSRKTTEYARGDHAYALMGLLRLRPKVDKTDSSFQAMARLSIANDSDYLLERLMCILPRSRHQHWSDTTDAYGVNLWDIDPTCQIAGICSDDTVLVDGAFGATVHWDRFQKVQNTRRGRSLKRLASQLLLHGAPHYFLIGTLLWRCAEDAKTFVRGVEKIPGDWGGAAAATVEHWVLLLKAVGLIFLAVACGVFISSPHLTRKLYKGKFWSTQAWLFGFEGYADLETIEGQIFGSRMHRLQWSPYGSSLSRHEKNEFGECIGIDPTIDPTVAQKVEDALNTDTPDLMRVFTLVDTNTMMVTMFEAVRPPTAVLLCGVEGGMQRAIACSYDWTTETCYRETVLRFETPVLEKMSRVSRFRFGIERPEGVQPIAKT